MELGVRLVDEELEDEYVLWGEEAGCHFIGIYDVEVDPNACEHAKSDKDGLQQAGAHS